MDAGREGRSRSETVVADEQARSLDGGARPRRARGLLAALREFAYGATGYEFARHAVETRSTLENLFLLSVVGEMIGVPILPPYYALRLVPYVVPDIALWKRRVLREREFGDMHEHHLHGV